MPQITEQQAQQALEMVKNYFRYAIDGDNAPKLIMDWDWFGEGRGTPSIVWEEGPYEWAIMYTGEHGRMPKGVFAEPATSWALSLYSDPSVDTSQVGDDNASGAEHDEEMRILYEDAMREFGGKNSSTDIELFTTFTPTFEKDSGANPWGEQQRDIDYLETRYDNNESSDPLESFDETSSENHLEEIENEKLIPAIDDVAMAVLREHKPSEYRGRVWQPLTRAEVAASARVLGRAGDMDPEYARDPDNYVIEVTYGDDGRRAIYEAGPNTEPILWMN